MNGKDGNRLPDLGSQRGGLVPAARAQVDQLVSRLEDNSDGAGPWALWSMASIGARGVDRERIFDVVLSHSEHEDVYLRTWAVNALAKFGGFEVVDPLLNIAATDDNQYVRERAFCGLAQSGMLHVQTNDWTRRLEELDLLQNRKNRSN